jgi:hypothetical protein
MPFGYSFGIDRYIKKTVTDDGAQVTFKVTYPSLRPNEYGSDSKREDISKKFIQLAQDEVREYLKKKDPKSYPSVDEKNVRRMGKGNVEDNIKLLDKIAYASLIKYSLLFKDGTIVEKVPTKNGKINRLYDLIGGNLQTTKSGTTGGWHKVGSEIGKDEVTVEMVLNLLAADENPDLLIWQGKAQKEPEKRSESSYYDPYAAGPARGDIGDNPNPHPDDVMRNQAANPPPTSVTISSPPPLDFSSSPPNIPNPKMVQIMDATPMRFTLMNGRTFFPVKDVIPIYSDAFGRTNKPYSIEYGPFKPIGGTFSKKQLDELKNSYVDIDEIPMSNWVTAAGGRKSTRRRQRRSNTNRRIKQRKQSMKNHTRRRKTTRR